MTQEVTLAFTGASGAGYGWRLLENLLAQQVKVHLLISSAARVVFATEYDLKLPGGPEACRDFILEKTGASKELLAVYGKDDWFSPCASGSAAPKQMVICPCSTGTAAAIAHGMSDNLIERAADVSTIHLENLLTLSKAGAVVMPAAPGFYHQPQSVDDLIDFMVARILDHLGLKQQLVSRWGYGDPQ
jgi:4-hydroxy-3-polyprenylbenzoate decarboxylase